MATYRDDELPLDQLKISFDQKLRYPSTLFRLTPALRDRLPLPVDLKDTAPIYTFLEDDVSKGRGFFVVTRVDGDQSMRRVHPSYTSSLKPHSYGLRRSPWNDLTSTQESGGAQDVCSRIVHYTAHPRLLPTSYIRYHRATNLRSNWIALGDSVMTLNPLFSEGCTKDFRGALSLHNVLRDALRTSANTLPFDFSTRFFKEQYNKTDMAWQNTRLMDYGVPMTVPLPGENLSSGKYLRWYIRQLQYLALTDDHAALVMYNSAMGLASPIDAFNPNIILKIFWRACVR
ncbi:hypothetical protein B0H10DRAFT_2356351 [Mycena sp. CBHHK59/15]|nr:hypothetical protein B0H10DRAFT_2356351 [Mycena sp. CBHHK59/15]